MPVPSNLARGAAGRRSWAGEFALAVRCEEGLFVVLRRLVDPASALANPHTWQRVALPVADYPELDALPLTKTLVPEAPKRTYRQRVDEAKSTVHWGQRKLFMAELELLLDFASEAQLLVYAGAAEGQHLAFLCELFPEIEVEAWDPRPFAPSAADVLRCRRRRRRICTSTRSILQMMWPRTWQTEMSPSFS
ncbi:Hypothetical protein SCF082_LOCUS53253 [Durusdinium trenchii]|uniref:Poly(A) polymerase small subunit n=1 Tax=Durusdinium trenchii TaxID=1381693 RepID=A0ABP0SRZ5_9DINO